LARETSLLDRWW